MDNRNDRFKKKKTLELGNENIMWFSSISHNTQIINIILKYGYEIIELRSPYLSSNRVLQQFFLMWQSYEKYLYSGRKIIHTSRFG